MPLINLVVSRNFSNHAYMTKYNDNITKVYVNQEGLAVLKCPSCEKVRNSKVDKFKGARHVLKVKCNCGEQFLVNLEFRKTYRKEINLSGKYTLLPEKVHQGTIVVVNMSKGGVGLQISGAHNTKEGDKLILNFALDDAHGSEIEKKVVVRLVQGNYLGCEFIEASSHDKAIGFYLMV